MTADEDVKEVVWMDGDGDGGRVLWLRGGKEGKEGRTEVWCGVVGGVGVGEGGYDLFFIFSCVWFLR